MSILSGNRAVILINALLIIASGIVLNSFLSYKNYTLSENGNWESTKVKLSGVNGVYANMFTKPALRENHLDIAAWFGYQELIYNKSIDISSLRFQYLSGNFPFSVILNKTDSVSYGIYFHYKRDSACCLFVADREGRFLAVQKFFTGTNFQKWKWNDMEIKHSGDSVYLNIDHERYLAALFKMPALVRFGFRGGAFPVMIDNVSAFNANGEVVMQEKFDAPFTWHSQPVVFLFFFFGLLFFLYKSSYRSLLTAFNMSVLLGFVACYLVYFFYLSYRYPAGADYINWHGKTVTFESEQQVCARLKKQVPEVTGKPVILFIGSSQTWGAGTSGPGQAYPVLVGKNLRHYFNNDSITAVNSGICGTTSDVLYKHYAEEWYKLKPVLTVIDLSHNDHDSVVFRKYIRRFLAFNQAKHIKTLMLAEPNDHSYESLEVNHRIMEQEGNRFGVETVPLQLYMDSAYETGFVWWDWVHMTDYGYRLLAERITPCIASELQQDSSFLKFNKTIFHQSGTAGR